MRSKTAVFMLLTGALALAGCTTGNAFLAQNLTNVELSGDNFDIVAKGVMGTAHADYLLGFSASGELSSPLESVYLVKVAVDLPS